MTTRYAVQEFLRRIMMGKLNKSMNKLNASIWNLFLLAFLGPLVYVEGLGEVSVIHSSSLVTFLLLKEVFQDSI